MIEFSEFIQTYGSEAKLVIWAAGCGASLSNLLMVPGASRVMEEVRLLYGMESISGFQPEDGKSVSVPFVAKMLQLMNIAYPNTNNVAITGALATDRRRKGQDHAFVGISDADGRQYCRHLIFKPINETSWNQVEQGIMRARFFADERRFAQDRALSRWVMHQYVRTISYNETEIDLEVVDSFDFDPYQ